MTYATPMQGTMKIANSGEHVLLPVYASLVSKAGTALNSL